MVKLMPGAVADCVGMACAPMIEASNSSSPCGMWHCGALIVVHLRQVHVVQAGGEVDVVVAGAAGRAAGIGQPVVGLRRAVLRVVAGLAVARIGDGSGIRRIHHGGPVAVAVEAVDLVRRAGLHAGQRGAVVDACG